MGSDNSKRNRISDNPQRFSGTKNVNSRGPRKSTSSFSWLQNKDAKRDQPKLSRENRSGSVPISRKRYKQNVTQNRKTTRVELTKIDRKIKEIIQEVSESSPQQNVLNAHTKLRSIQEDLQNLYVESDTELKKFKNRLEKEHTYLWLKISKQISEISKNRDLRILSDIKKDIHSFDNLNGEDFEKYRRRFNEHKQNLKAIESIDEEVKSEKNKTSQLLKNIENAFKTHDRIINAEIEYEKSVKLLQTLKEDLALGTTTHRYIQDRRNALLKKIENIIVTYNNSKKTEPSKNQGENPEISLSKIERRLNQLQTETSSFYGVESNDEYFEIDEPLIQMSLKLDCFKFDEYSDLHRRKVALLKKVNELQSELDKNVEQTKAIKKIEREIEEISFKTNVLKDSSEITISENLKDRLKKLTSSVNLLQPNNEPLKKKKAECSDKIFRIQAKLDNISK